MGDIPCNELYDLVCTAGRAVAVVVEELRIGEEC
jgi:hypothetical protein